MRSRSHAFQRAAAVDVARAYAEAHEVPGPLAASGGPPCPYCGAAEGEGHAAGCRRGPDAPVLAPPVSIRARAYGDHGA